MTKEIAYCNDEFKTLLTGLQCFCQTYGIALEQLQEKRGELQQYLVKLQYCCKSMLEEAKKLRDKIDDRAANFVESDNVPFLEQPRVLEALRS